MSDDVVRVRDAYRALKREACTMQHREDRARDQCIQLYEILMAGDVPALWVTEILTLLTCTVIVLRYLYCTAEYFSYHFTIDTY